jgi:diguanylate cyclase (GGDEF)-like protein/putative nucleotidyltransferase with HDIG domain
MPERSTSSAAFSTLPDQGRQAEARGEYQAAREYYERALRELDVDAPLPAVGALLLQIARTHVGAGNTPAAGDCVEAILALPDHTGLEIVLAEAYELRGRLACGVGRLDQAEQDFTAARDLAREANYGVLVAAGEEHLSAVALVRGDWAAGARHLERAVAEFAAAGDDPASVRSSLQLAGLYVDLKRWNAAEQAFADALPRAQALGDVRSQALIELARAQMAIDRANTERARASAERALELARRAEDAEAIARAVLMTAVVTRELDDAARATRFFDDAERHAEVLRDTMLSAELYCERAELLARQGKHSETLRALNNAHREMARVQGHPGTSERARRLRRLETAFIDAARRWAQRIESQDHDTGGHVERVADLTCEIARRMGVDPAALFWYRIGAYLHDIGKLHVPAAVLNKQGRLTTEEWALIKRHPAAGAEMLRDADFPWEVRPIVESHHECWDGSGYPHGLAGEEIPMAARIFCVADVYDALVSRRPFKHALSREEALDAMRRDVGRQFDPAVFRVFEDVLREGVAIPGITSATALPTPTPTDAPVVDDPLTSVTAASSWSRRAAQLLADRRGSDRVAALLLIDLDHFSRVNTTYGRLQGDDLLWAVAKVLQRGVRAGDLLGRRGGDEFVVLLPDTTLAVALDVAERLRDAVAGLRCARRDAPDEAVSVSISVAVAAAPSDGESVETLFASADRALFRAKREGRDRVVVADHNETVHARAALDFDAFVGREDELRTLVGQLDLAARGDPRFVGLTGEAGIGKSALVAQLEPEVRLRGGTMMTGRVAETGDRTASHWVSILTALQSVGALDARGAGILAQLTPDPDAPSGEWLPPLPFLQQEIVSAVRRSARQHLRVIVLEDLHAADTATWAILDGLLASVDDERLLICYTLRPDEAHGAAEWRRRLVQHPRSVPLMLRRFSLDEIRRWIRAVFHDAAPGDDVSRFVAEYAEGVPRDVLLVLRACCDDGTIWYGGTRWEWRPVDARALPPGVGLVLQRRLDRLGSRERSLLATAAILGDSLNVELLVAATGVNDTDARAALDAGVAASVLEPLNAARGERFAFRHPLLADACTRDVPERQRQRTHDVAARVLELRSPSQVEQIANHYHAAGDDEAAYGYVLQVAERSLSVFAHDAAIDALQLAQRFAPSSRELAELRVRYAETAALAGRFAHAESLCDLAVEWLERQPLSVSSHRARRLREGLQLRRGKHTARAMEALATLTEEAEAEVLDTERASSCFVAAECALLRADWPLAGVYANRGMDAVHAAAAPAMAAHGLLLSGLAQHPESPTAGIALIREAQERLSEAGDLRGASRAALALGDALLRSASSQAADEALTTALERARHTRNAPVAAAASRSLGELRARQGKFDEALQWLGDAERLFTTMADAPDRARTLFATGMVHRMRGDRSEAFTLFDTAARHGKDLDLAWLEMAASAGAALSNGGPNAEGAKTRWARVSELIADARPDWWFPGRELVDALAVRMALASGHAGFAYELFQRSGRRYEAVDPYALLWLVAEAGSALESAGLRNASLARDNVARLARQLGYTPAAGIPLV